MPTTPITFSSTQKTTMPKTTTHPTVTFKLHAPNAREVRLAGDFTDWQRSAKPLRRNPSGTWETELRLRPGRHQYKFIVDGQWQNDPVCAQQETNPFGTTNNIIEVR